MAKTKKIEKLRDEVSYRAVTDSERGMWGLHDEGAMQNVFSKINEIIDAVNELSKPKTSASTKLRRV